MPNLITPPKLLDSTQAPANGTIAVRVTASFGYVGDIITTVPGLGQIIGGEFKNAAGDGLLVLPTTPALIAVELVAMLVEQTPEGARKVTIRRTVSVPAGVSVTWDDLVDMVPVIVSGEYIVPPWIADLLTARDEAVAAAASAEAARAAAVVAKDAAVVAKNAAEAVPTTTDGLMAGIDANAASAFRVQADARQSAATASAIAAKISTPAAFAPVWSAGTQVAIAGAVGRWTQVGKLVTYRFYVRCSVANTAGTWTLSLPVPPLASGAVSSFGTVGVRSAGVYNSAQAISDGTGKMQFLMPGSTTYLATAPAVNDEIFGSITYEAV